MIQGQRPGEGMDRAALETRLAELRVELDRVEGTATEVYSRIVGYYRSVRNWNAGKRDEYASRRYYAVPLGEGGVGVGEPRPSIAKARSHDAASAHSGGQALVRAARLAQEEGLHAEIRGEVLVFTREACPNCPPVANYVMGSGMRAVFVDVDREEGLELARRHGVLSTPTVLALDSDGAECFRALDLRSLKAKVENGASWR